MRFSLALLSALSVAALSVPAHATPVVFNFTSNLVFSDNSGNSTADGTLDGTITIDTTAGLVTAEALTYLAGPTKPSGFTTLMFDGGQLEQFPFDGNTGRSDAGNDSYGVVSIATNHITALQLLFPTNSLVGYSGGTVCDGSILDSTGCDGYASLFAPGDGEDIILDGTLTPTSISASPVPEPSSLVLLGTGLITAASAARRRIFPSRR